MLKTNSEKYACHIYSHFSKFRGRNKTSLKPPPRGLESGICVDFSLKKPYFLGICLFQCLQSGVIILPLQTMHLEILEMYYTFASFDCCQNGSHLMIPFSWLETKKLPYHWGPMGWVFLDQFGWIQTLIGTHFRGRNFHPNILWNFRRIKKDE